MTTPLDQGIQAYKAGNKQEAIRYLAIAVQQSPQNVSAWLWLSYLVDDPKQKKDCLERVLRLDPHNQSAHDALVGLDASFNSELPVKQNPINPTTRPNKVPVNGNNLKEQDSYQDKPRDGLIQCSECGQENPIDARYCRRCGGNLLHAHTHSESALLPAKQNPIKQPVQQYGTLQSEKEKGPGRWWQRFFTIAGTACLWAPWVLIQSGCNGSRELSGAQLVQESMNSSFGYDMLIAAPAILVLILLIFFCFKSRAAQKWGERSTFALVPLAALPSLDLITSFYAKSTGVRELRWGIWLYCAFFSLVGLAALINARRIGTIDRMELSTAVTGRVFTWLFSIGDILIILLIVIGSVISGISLNSAIFITLIWLFMAAILSHTI